MSNDIKRDLPPEMGKVGTILKKFGYQHNYYTVFSTILDMMIFAWRGPHQKQEYHDQLQRLRDESVAKYGDEEKKVLNDLFFEILNVWKEQVEDSTDIDGFDPRKWYDPFGTLFECTKGHGNKAAAGQFFTPVPVCDFMAQIQMQPPMVQLFPPHIWLYLE